jgi:hypothetical protein
MLECAPTLESLLGQPDCLGWTIQLDPHGHTSSYQGILTGVSSVVPSHWIAKRSQGHMTVAGWRGEELQL